MRRLLALALVLATLVAGDARAQVDDEPLRVTMDRWHEPLMPNGPTARTTVTADVSCALATWERIVVVRFELLDAPDWTHVVIETPEARVPIDECDDMRTVVQGRVAAQARPEAPARTPAVVTVGVRVEGWLDRAEAETSAPLEAAYFTIVTVAAPHSLLRAEPGAFLNATVHVANLGNGPTRVEFAQGSADSPVQMQAPAPVILESRQQGGRDTRAEVLVPMRAPLERGPSTVTLAVAYGDAEEPRPFPRADTITFLVTVPNETPAEAAQRALTPGPHAWAAALALVGVALVAPLARRPSRLSPPRK